MALDRVGLGAEPRAGDGLLPFPAAGVGPAAQHLLARLQAVEQEASRLAAIVAALPTGVAVVDLRGAGCGLLFANPAFTALTGYRSEEVIGCWCEPFAGPATDAITDAEIRAALADRRPYRGEVLHYRKDGSTYWCDLTCLPVRDDTGTVRYLVSLHADITERKQEEDRLVRMAQHDQLTHLPNRTLFLEQLGRVLMRARRLPDEQFAVLFLDVDRFKNVNDSLGHLVGDQLLIAVARRFTAALRAGDMLARLGGDEFAILLERIGGVDVAVRVAERLQQAFATPCLVNGYEVFVTASIGIAIGTGTYDQPDGLLRDADTAMYQAKAQGRARCVVFNRDMHARAVALLQLETDLRRGLGREEFRLYYQPIVRLGDGALRGYEALARWQHPRRGLISPSAFVPTAEETGLIVPLGRWVCAEACRQLRAWQHCYPAVEQQTISVNISSKEFSRPDLLAAIDAILAETGLPARNLKLEITESAIMEHPDLAGRLLDELRARQIRVSLDDFGTGYSSLSALHRLPIDTLKIDRSFVARLGGDAEALEVVRTIITLAHTLGKDVTAEGVETNDQRMVLQALGCDYAQGALFSMPVPPQTAELLLQRRQTTSAGG